MLTGSWGKCRDQAEILFRLVVRADRNVYSFVSVLLPLCPPPQAVLGTVKSYLGIFQVTPVNKALSVGSLGLVVSSKAKSLQAGQVQWTWRNNS